METRIEHVFTHRGRTSEEAARDDAIRRAVKEEFPPARSADLHGPGTFSDTLRDSLRSSERPLDQIAASAGVSPTLLARFLGGECDIHITTADRLAKALDLVVAAVE
ncbi:MAG: helix-turn-helix transcriptional regulator [Pirellulales bacterium]